MQNPEYTYGNFDIPDVSAPGVSPYLQALRNRQKSQSDSYRKNLGAYSDQLYDQAESQARKELATTIKDVRRDYNRRGLLQSGGRLAGESEARAATSTGLLDTRKNINDAVYGRANELENNVFKTDLGITGNAPGLGASALGDTANDVGNEISKAQAQQQVFSGFGQGLGSLAGQLAANRRNSVYNG